MKRTDNVRADHQFKNTITINKELLASKEGIEIVFEGRIWNIYYDNVLQIYMLGIDLLAEDSRYTMLQNHNAILYSTLKKAKMHLKALEEEEK